MRIHPALDAGHGPWTLGEQQARHGQGASIERGRLIDELVHQPQRMCGPGIERLRREGDRSRTAAGVAAQRGKADRRAQADAVHGVGEAGGRSGNHDIAGRDERTTTREGRTLHGRHDRAGHRAQRAHGRREPLKEGAHHRGIGDTGAEVKATAERATGRGKQHARCSLPAGDGA